MPAKKRWRSVKGPVTALVSTMADIGWSMPDPVTLCNQEGEQHHLLEGDQNAIRYQIQRTLEEQVWKDSGTSHMGGGMEISGVNLEPVIAQMKAYDKAGEKGRSRLCAVIAEGGCWHKARRKEAYPQEIADDKCAWCGEQDTDWHANWGCRQLERQGIPAVDQSQHLLPKATLQMDRHPTFRQPALPCYWLRGLLPNHAVELPPPSDTEDREEEGQVLLGYEGEVCGDGSGGERTSDAKLRRCGWAVVQVVPLKSQSTWPTCAGKLTGPKQTVPRAELAALLHVAKNLGGDTVYWTDHINIVRRLSPGNLPQWEKHKKISGANSENQDQWEAIFEARKKAGHSLQAKWVNSNSGTDPEERSPAIPAYIYSGNDLADEAAKKAAKQHDIPAAIVEEVEEHQDTARLIIRRLVEVALAKMAEATKPVVKRNKKMWTSCQGR